MKQNVLDDVLFVLLDEQNCFGRETKCKQLLEIIGNYKKKHRDTFEKKSEVRQSKECVWCC